ncbi:MAG: cobalt ECF transporter T component CbiQ [Acidobacteria bacterium]|nr:cobalt ECF transporter T component CbiQ [Acidobacteriota bacterium]
MKHDFIDRYSKLNSPIHRLDPRTKLLAFFLGILLVVSVPRGELLPLAADYALIAGVILAARLPLAFIAQRCLLAAPFILFSAVLLPLSLVVSGESAWPPPATATLAAASIALKAFAAILLMTVLTSTEKFHNLLAALNRLRLPRIIGTISLLMYHYIFVFIDELHKTRRARESRTPGRLRINRFMVFGNQAATIFLRSWNRAYVLHAAMLSRGFTGQFPAWKEFHFSRSDALFSLLWLLGWTAVHGVLVYGRVTLS